MGIEPSFPIKRSFTRKKKFDEPDHDEEVLLAEKVFEVNYFLVMVELQKSLCKIDLKNLKCSKIYLASYLTQKT
jgi:hypothetical protein